ncbi:MAG TPA: hypothetical protein VFF39_11715, partial [Verrucomicrobiae bacterium]|nr:hypothetical protein [Verrucomicrobiae bacterium]
RRITLSTTAPEYLIDRARMWEAAARFLRNDKSQADLERALELLERLRESKGRVSMKHDIYNVAVVSQLLGGDKLESAHTCLVELGQIPEPWGILAVFEKAQLLSALEYRRVWGKFESEVRAWQKELLNFASDGKVSSDDEFSYELRRIRPSDTAIWNAIVAAELDFPRPSRPSDHRGASDSRQTITAAKNFLVGQLAHGSGNLTDTYLQLARVYLYLGDLQEARKFALQYSTSANGHTAISAYVEAEATYGDAQQNQLNRTIKAQELIQPFANDSYAPLQALKNAIASDRAKDTP